MQPQTSRVSKMSVVTRFAPSPTGHLHIGGARTALFNWLFARSNGGKFLLRIEDTDRVRSTPEATEAILKGLSWLRLDWDGDPVSQNERQSIHRQMAYRLLESGHAYKCFSTPEEIADYRNTAKQEGAPTLFASPWRDIAPTNHPNRSFTIRLKTPTEGQSFVDDKVFGRVTVNHDSLDDFILLRSDGTPTYNLAVVIDDRHMRVTHIIRGNDHLANTLKQKLVYDAFEWPCPVFAHVPLIHNEAGKKLSKRDGAEGIEFFFDNGIIPEAACNFLARLGWSHDNTEFFRMEQAKKWFRIEDLRKSPARFDPKILNTISGLHLKNLEIDVLYQHLVDFVGRKYDVKIDHETETCILKAIPLLRTRAKTLVDLWNEMAFLRQKRIDYGNSPRHILDQIHREAYDVYLVGIQKIDWTRPSLEDYSKDHGNKYELGLGQVVQPLRIALTGKKSSPSVFDLFMILGRDESLRRLHDLKTHLRNH